MSDDLMERFDEAEGSESDDDEPERTETAGGGATSESATTATRSRSQYPMYLSEELQEELDDRFNKFNARRELDDQEQVEKHKHFLEGLIRVALERDDIEQYVEQELQR
jgi:hypothetical protein